MLKNRLGAPREFEVFTSVCHIDHDVSGHADIYRHKHQSRVMVGVTVPS
jgi:hypothetical protein